LDNLFARPTAADADWGADSGQRLAVRFVQANVVRPRITIANCLTQPVGYVILKFGFQAGQLGFNAVRFNLETSQAQPSRPQCPLTTKRACWPG
jgi:hypothetical protein